MTVTRLKVTDIGPTIVGELEEVSFFSEIDLRFVDEEDGILEIECTIPTPFGEKPMTAKMGKREIMTIPDVRGRKKYALRIYDVDSCEWIFDNSLQEMMATFQRRFYSMSKKGGRNGIKYLEFLKSIRDYARAEILDFNQFSEEEEFRPQGVQVNLFLREGAPAVQYQTSSTLDIGGSSHRLDINEESGGIRDLRKALLLCGLDEEFVDEYIYDAADDLKNRFAVQELYDDYVSQFGHWEPSWRGMDANSEVFVFDNRED
jgi:hypothetical protein